MMMIMGSKDEVFGKPYPMVLCFSPKLHEHPDLLLRMGFFSCVLVQKPVLANLRNEGNEGKWYFVSTDGVSNGFNMLVRLILIYFWDSAIFDHSHWGEGGEAR